MLDPLQLEVLVVFVVVYALIVFRRIGRFKIEIWMAMLLGAVSILALGVINLAEAFASVNTSVLLFLFGAFLQSCLLSSSFNSPLQNELFSISNLFHFFCLATFMLFLQANG